MLERPGVCVGIIADVSVGRIVISGSGVDAMAEIRGVKVTIGLNSVGVAGSSTEAAPAPVEVNPTIHRKENCATQQQDKHPNPPYNPAQI